MARTYGIYKLLYFCPIRFTTEMIDSKRSPAVAVNKAIEIVSRENQTTCAGRSPVISFLV